MCVCFVLFLFSPFFFSLSVGGKFLFVERADIVVFVVAICYYIFVISILAVACVAEKTLFNR